MTEFWEAAFTKMQTAWGLEPTASALLACDYFTRKDVKDVLIPGIGYGRNARPFLDRGMSVAGIEISETAIALARTELGLEIPIAHGSVVDMPFAHRKYDGIFSHGLIYLLDQRGRQKFIRDCYRQLTQGGHMIFTLISKKAPMYGQGPRLGEDWYERLPNLPMYFYDADSVKREFDPYGLVEFSELEEPSDGDVSLPFIYVVCRRHAVMVDAEQAVKRLRAGDAEVTVEGSLELAEVEAIADALKTSKSTILRMGGCRITDVGGQAIGDALAGNTALRELWLFSNEIGDIGARAIGSALSANDVLTTLCLENNHVGDAGAKAVAAALCRTNRLEELGLGHNRIGNAGAEAMRAAIANGIALTTFQFDGNPVSPATQAAVEAALERSRA